MFETLVTHWAAQKERSILSLFASEDRASEFSVRADQLFFDYSKTNLDKPTRQALLDLASAQGLTQKRAAMFSGAPINATEGRAVLHSALRNFGPDPVIVAGSDVMPNVRDSRARMTTFAKAVRGGEYRGQGGCLLYTSPSPRDAHESRMPSSA